LFYELYLLLINKEITLIYSIGFLIIYAIFVITVLITNS